MGHRVKSTPLAFLHTPYAVVCIKHPSHDFVTHLHYPVLVQRPNHNPHSSCRIGAADNPRPINHGAVRASTTPRLDWPYCVNFRAHRIAGDGQCLYSAWAITTALLPPMPAPFCAPKHTFWRLVFAIWTPLAACTANSSPSWKTPKSVENDPRGSCRHCVRS